MQGALQGDKTLSHSLRIYFLQQERKLEGSQHMNSELAIFLTHFPDETAESSPEDL